MKRVILIVSVIFSLFAINANGQKSVVTASAPSVVEVGESFQLQFSVNAKAQSIDFKGVDGFSIIGPSTSYSSSSSWVNGKSSSNTTYSYTYVLTAQKEGKYTIPAATVKVDGNSITSNTLLIEVVKGENGTAGVGDSATETASSKQSNSALFTVVDVSRSSLYMGEALVATIKLYVGGQTALEGFYDSQFPKFEGFLSEELENNQNLNFQRVNYGGSVYNMAVIRKLLLYPQHSGTLTIEPFELGCVIREEATGRRSMMDDFFGNYTSKKILKKSSPVQVTVKDLPLNGRPSDFSGIVGNVVAKATISADSIDANEALTYKITLSGSGNLKLIKAPKITFPHEFEAYEPKITKNIKASASGNSGDVVFEYILIPRYAGVYEIPAVSIPYFNTSSNRYEETKTSAFSVKVLKGSFNGTNNSTPAVQSFKKEDVRQVGEDIRFIKTGDLKLKAVGDYYYGSLLYWLSFIVPSILFVAGALYNRKRIAAAADVVRVKNKSANKMAKRRLKSAALAMKNGEGELFYQAVLSALWGYVSYKLNIESSLLNRENISDILEKRGVSEVLIDKFIAELDECEFARYAPGKTKNEAMDKIYSESINVITELDKVIK